MDIELPFRAEYAKSGRAKCKGCMTNIGNEELRLAAMVQSAFHDGKQPNWFHEHCFFVKQRPRTVGDIKYFEQLRFEDQERLQKKVSEIGSKITSIGGSKGKKRSKAENTALKDFGIEYSKSARALCRGCEQKILKDEIRIWKKVFDTEVGMKYGGQSLYHHVECFIKLRNELGWIEGGDCLPGFKSLNSADQNSIKELVKPIHSEASTSKRVKEEPKDEVANLQDAELLNTIKKQSKLLFQFRDNVKQHLKKNEIIELLENNNQEPVTGNSEKLLNQIADMLTFGAIAPCPQCNGRKMLFNKSGYLCNGQLTEWSKCTQLIMEPKRSPCRIPAELKKQYEFLKNVAKTPVVRAVRVIPPSIETIAKNIKVGDVLDGPKVKRDIPPLIGFTFSYIGPKIDQAALKTRLAKLGAKLETAINTKTAAIFSTEDEVKRMNKRMEKAKEMGIHIIPMEFIDSIEAEPVNSSGLKLINSLTLCDWGTDPSSRIVQDLKSKSKSIYTKSVPKSVTLKVKGGLAVDPDSGLEEIAHVLVHQKIKYNAVLGLTDIQRNKNSFYKLQLLESDTKNKYWIFRSWGRIGTTIGGKKVENCASLLEGIKLFESLYREKTGNEFNETPFIKVPGRMYPIDVDYNDTDDLKQPEDSKIPSKLDPQVQSLVKLLFDIEAMKQTLLEFNLDMEKMPLGKLSQKQIQSAYKVLTELFQLIQNGSSQSSFIDATNRFFTLIPHNFGIESPPLLDTAEQIEKLRVMLDSLMEIECAYNLIRSEDDNEDKNPVDKHYEQLKTKIEPLDKNSEEFKILQKYVEVTHASTHDMYELEIVDVFKVARQGESRRYKPFKKLHNRKLLWHGSRLTNYAGILLHGLKIAPPEAPATGYMFGKGIYFADMVSKSANYCFTSNQNSTGILLLSEVALGDMLECTNAKYITKLPQNKHCCYGHGKTMPDPRESYMREDGVEIPLGKPITNNNLKSSLLYNEYIVYDIAQVNIQYLFRMNFKHKY